MTHTTHPAAIERAILHLAHLHHGLPTRKLAQLIGVPHADVARCARGLVQDRRAFETRTDRQTKIHCTVARLDPLLERTGYEEALLARLAIHPERAETAARVAAGLPITAREAAATLERASVWRRCRAWNVGDLRVFQTNPAR